MNRNPTILKPCIERTEQQKFLIYTCRFIRLGVGRCACRLRERVLRMQYTIYYLKYYMYMYMTNVYLNCVCIINLDQNVDYLC